MTGEIEAMREAIVERLAGLDDFAGVKVLSRKVGDLENQIDREVGKIGVCALVIFDGATPKAHQTRRPLLDPVKFVVRVIENVTVNQGAAGTKKGALFLAERALAALQMWRFGEAAPLIPGAEGIREANVLSEKEDEYIVDVNFFTRLAPTPAA